MSSTPVIIPVVPGSVPIDQDPFVVMLALLNSINVFEDVILGARTQRSQAGSDIYPLAIVTPRGWEESDDFDPTMIIRRVRFAITIVVKSEDSCLQLHLLDQLSSAIKNVVDRSSLGGTCLPALTWIRKGDYEFSAHYPEQSVDLEGEFSLIIEPSAIVPVTS